MKRVDPHGWKNVRQASVTRCSKTKQSRVALFCVTWCAALLASVALDVAPLRALDSGALPTGGRIVSGQGSITTSGNQMTVIQRQNTMIADWNTFNIGQKAGVTFVQPGASSVALNLILDQNPSLIFGSLKANGEVFLLNPSGIIFGPTSRLDVGGLVASSLDLSKADYLAGTFQFTNAGHAGSVINQGTINTADYGVVALIAPQVSNRGTINAPAGSVVLAAGNRAALDFAGDGLIKVSVDEAALDAAVANSGAIMADGGRVFMTARSADALMATVVNNTGIIEANSISEKNGVIVFDGGSQGTTSNSGTISARGNNAGETGGTIEVLGNNVSLRGNGVIDVSGASGGGTVLVGGNFEGKGPEPNANSVTVESGFRIAADAITSGNGGNVAVWSDGKTDFAGTISARGGANSGNGGYAEVSGKSLSYQGFTDLRAPFGATGTLLLDPTDYTIAATGGDITGTALGNQLDASNVTIQTKAGGSQPGDITVDDNITWTGSTTLTLSAYRDIIFDTGSTITAPAGSVVGRADSTGTGSGTFMGSPTITVGGTATGYYNPSDWTHPMNNSAWSGNVTAGGGKIAYALVNDAAHLQLMSNDLSGNYALGKDIDASATATWNGNAGFAPIGTSSSPFTGVFNGLGCSITGLYINRPTNNYVGLFGYTSGATIKKAGLIGDNIQGYSNVGGIAGYAGAGTTIKKCYTTGGATANEYSDGSVGGLVGELYNSAVSNSYNTGEVTGQWNVGGVVGWATNGSTISSSYNTGVITGQNFPLNYVGGVVGWLTVSSIVSNSYNTGAVSVLGGSGSTAGGLVGYASGSTIEYSYNAGAVTGSGVSTGGLIGEASGTTVTNSYYDTVKSGAGGAYGTGESTSEMMQLATYVGWDFTNTWAIMAGSSYPYLQWQSAPPTPAPSAPAAAVVQTVQAAQTSIQASQNTTSSIQGNPTSTSPAGTEEEPPTGTTSGGAGSSAGAGASGGALPGAGSQVLSANDYIQQATADRAGGDFQGAATNFRQAANLLIEQGSLPQAREMLEMMNTAELQDYFADASLGGDQTHKTRLRDLPKDTAVIYTLIFPQRLDLILSTRSGIKRFSTPVEAAALSQRINRLRVNLQRRSRWDYLADTQEFYNLIMKPLDLELSVNGINTIIFVPDGALRTVPFAALNDGNQFLIEKYAVVVVPNLELTDPRPLRPKDTMVLSAGLTESVQGFAPLSKVKSELDSIQGLYRTDRLENNTFVSDNIGERLRDNPYSIVHIATHGNFAPEASNTFLLAWDTKINMNQLDQLIKQSSSRGKPVELLCLSACETAAGDDRAALGLAGVAVKAGARSALATLWSVDDVASSQLVLKFYEQLKNPGVTKAEALQSAQLMLLDDPRYRHPYYWSPFLLIGNWL